MKLSKSIAGLLILPSTLISLIGCSDSSQLKRIQSFYDGFEKYVSLSSEQKFITDTMGSSFDTKFNNQTLYNIKVEKSIDSTIDYSVKIKSIEKDYQSAQAIPRLLKLDYTGYRNVTEIEMYIVYFKYPSVDYENSELIEYLGDAGKIDKQSISLIYHNKKWEFQFTKFFIEQYNR
jgi:hypothetical protein